MNTTSPKPPQKTNINKYIKGPPSSSPPPPFKKTQQKTNPKQTNKQNPTQMQQNNRGQGKPEGKLKRILMLENLAIICWVKTVQSVNNNFTLPAEVFYYSF